jgi:PAS domain S-box-containing protein
MALLGKLTGFPTDASQFNAMSGILVPTLYVVSGVCAFAALHHGLAVMRRRVNRIHLIFAVLSLSIMALILAKAGAYQVQTGQELVALRKWEVSAICLFFALFPWFVAEYTDVRPRKLLVGLSVFWGLMFAVDLSLPYGIQYVDLPRLTYFDLPWGESVVDLRVLQPGFWHKVGWLGILVVMAFSLYACIVQYRSGQQRRARALAWALGLFFAFILFNLAVNLQIIRFVHLSDFGFISVLVMMDLEIMLESRDQNRRMRAVLDHLPSAICLKDPTGRIQLINRGFETFFHVKETDALGRTDLDLLPREQAEHFRADEERALETRQEVENEHVLEWNGTQYIYQAHQFPMLRPDGTAYAVCGVYIDITESRQKDEALHKLHRQVWHSDRVASTGAITGSLAHEICQPLSAILNNAQAGLRFLSQDRVDLEEMREILQDIVRDDKRAGTVINGLRAMLQQQETPYDDINLAQCIEEVIELLHSEFIRHGVEVVRVLETNLTVRANKTQIQQVLLNLMINAMEAMAEQPAGGRRLRVSATHADRKALVSISDTGVGIADDMLNRIFDGFYTTKPQGLGVGLEVCRSIVESHRGAIWAEANPDRGATFHFTLPFAQAASTTKDSASA